LHKKKESSPDFGGQKKDIAKEGNYAKKISGKTEGRMGGSSTNKRKEGKKTNPDKVHESDL